MIKIKSESIKGAKIRKKYGLKCVSRIDKYSISEYWISIKNDYVIYTWYPSSEGLRNLLSELVVKNKTSKDTLIHIAKEIVKIKKSHLRGIKKYEDIKKQRRTKRLQLKKQNSFKKNE